MAIGQNMGKMSAEDRERSAKGLRSMREQHERAIRMFNEHAAECEYCEREALVQFNDGGTMRNPDVVTHCRRGLELRDQREAFGAIYRSSKHTLATFGVTE